MTPDVVVDVGNSRIKWGRCQAGKVRFMASLDPTDLDAWFHQAEAWDLGTDRMWVLSGVQPFNRNLVRTWLENRHQKVTLLESFRQLPIAIEVDAPERVGLDRLLNAVAANQARRPRQAAIIIDAGSAVTVDFVDAAGVFQGGSIFPGLRLMSKALHAYTALLPQVEISTRVDPPGKNTIQAIETGVFHAVIGGIEAQIRLLRKRHRSEIPIFFTGGDASLLKPHLSLRARHWPEMTLEGIRASASSLPGESETSKVRSAIS